MHEAQPLTRRNFLQVAWAALMFGHLAAGGCAPSSQRGHGRVAPIVPHDARFVRLRLRTHRLREVESFYARTIGLPVISSASRSFVMRAGATTIEFEQVDDNTEPFYHFAFNIPENKFAQAKAWLTERCPLLIDSNTGSDEIFFGRWNAHAVYFHDPAGNIGELIARHTLSNARDGEFGVNDVLEASEIGLVVNDQDLTAQAICDEFGLSRYQGSSFFVGDEHGLFVLPVAGYPWIPERTQLAAIHPVEAIVRSTTGGRLTPDDLPYRIGVDGC